jgi:hypothetical protein
MIAYIFFNLGFETLDAPHLQCTVFLFCITADRKPFGLIAVIKNTQGRGLLPLQDLNRLLSEFRPQAD